MRRVYAGRGGEVSTPVPLGNLLTLVPCICTGQGEHTGRCAWWFAVGSGLASHSAGEKRAASCPGEEVQRRAAAARVVRAAARGATQ